jgi:hypothetical protein
MTNNEVQRQSVPRTLKRLTQLFLLLDKLNSMEPGFQPSDTEEVSSKKICQKNKLHWARECAPVWGHVRDKESNSWGRRVTHSICKGSSRKWQITMMQQKKHHPPDIQSNGNSVLQGQQQQQCDSWKQNPACKPEWWKAEASNGWEALSKENA